MMSARRWLATAVAGFLLAGASGPACGAGPDLEAPAPRERPAAPAVEEAPSPAAAPERLPAYVLPPPTWPAPSFPEPDLFLDRPCAPQSGWFADSEANVLFVHLRNQLSIPVVNPVTGPTESVRFPGNKLDATVSPRFELGYRFGDGCGEVLLSYRFLATCGADQTNSDAFQGLATQQGRLDYNIFDLGYGSREYALDPSWAMRWGVGGRFSTLFFDSRLAFEEPAAGPGSVLAQGESNQFYAFGVFGVLDLSRKLPVAGWSAFGRMEAAGLVGRLTQTGTETVAGAAGAGPAFAETRLHVTIGNPMARWILGLSYEPSGWNHSRLMLGYEYEVWWEIGRVAGNGSEAQLDAHGVFLRAEFNF